jgi:hypothetical protein
MEINEAVVVFEPAISKKKAREEHVLVIYRRLRY